MGEVRLLEVVTAEDLVVSGQVVFVAGEQRALAVVAAEAVGVVSSVACRAREQFVRRERLLTFGAFRGEQSTREKRRRRRSLRENVAELIRRSEISALRPRVYCLCSYLQAVQVRARERASERQGGREIGQICMRSFGK